LGHDLKLLIRESSDISPFKDLENIEYVKGDVRDIDSLYNGVDGVDYIYHLAAYVKIWAQDPLIYDEINIQGSENIAKVALDKDLILVYISSFAALGPNPEDCEGSADETCEHVDFFQNDYERTKYYGREKIQEYMKKGLKSIIFYPGFVYGGGDFNLYGQMLYDIVTENFMGCPGDGEAIFCMAYINDIVNAMVQAINREDLIGEDFFLGGENIKFGDYIDLIAEIAGNKKPRRFPMWAGVLYANYCKLKAKLTKKNPYITPDMIVGMKYDWSFSSEKAKKMLDYKITPLKDALEETIKWYKNYHQLLQD
ncbi:MAG: NAD-dependent epimerase/dehydratase family protein, partial [Candidatus Lokiarchaeota archaeon]